MASVRDNLIKTGGSREFYIQELKTSGYVSSHNTPLSYAESLLTLDSSNYDTLTMHASLGASVGHVQLFVTDADTSEVLFQSNRGASYNGDVSVELTGHSHVQVRVRGGEPGVGYGGSFWLTLTEIRMM